MDIDAIKDRVCAEVDCLGPTLLDVSHSIWATPELCYLERHAHDLLCDHLEAGGLRVSRGAYGLDTAFDATAGAGPSVAVLCEYDALPEIGHGCGHNLIAAVGLGAGLAASSVSSELGGTIRVLGTPAEEGGGGKILMARRGAFDDVEAALMVHPGGADLTRMEVIAVRHVWADYRGRAAHAAAFPHLGRNALDAAVLGYLNVAALRQHIRSTERVHGIFTKAGDKPNIVPDHAATHWYVRAADLDALETLTERVVACLEAGATAAGCEIEVILDRRPYSDMLHNQPVVEAYRANAARLGREVHDPAPDLPVVAGSTDMGNVSHLVPSIHPVLASAPPRAAIHTAEFARHASGELGDQAVLDGAKVLAMTVVDLWASAELRAAAHEALRAAGPADRAQVVGNDADDPGDVAVEY